MKNIANSSYQSDDLTIDCDENIPTSSLIMATNPVTSTSTNFNITSNSSSGVWMGGANGTGGWYNNGTGYYTSTTDLTNYYCTAKDFIHDIVKNKFKEEFKFTTDCIVEITQEIIENPSTRNFIKEHMPILMLKSNDIGIFIFNAVINQIEEDNK